MSVRSLMRALEDSSCQQRKTDCVSSSSIRLLKTSAPSKPASFRVCRLALFLCKVLHQVPSFWSSSRLPTAYDSRTPADNVFASPANRRPTSKSQRRISTRSHRRTTKARRFRAAAVDLSIAIFYPASSRSKAFQDVWRGVALPPRCPHKCGQPLPPGLLHDHVL